MTGRGEKLGGTTFLLIVAVGVLNALAELSFKKGAMATHIHVVTLSNLPGFALGILSSTGLWTGILCYLVMFLLWMTVLSQIDLSVAFLVLSVDYLLVPCFSILFLKEGVPFLRWVGIALVVVGICLTSGSTASDRGSTL